MINWTKLRNEYINGHISYRKLAEKHGISYSTLKDVAWKEKWGAKRREQQEKIRTKTAQKSAEKISDKQSDFAVNLQNAAQKLLTKIEKALDETDLYTEKTKIRVPKKVKDNATGEVFTAWQEDENIRLSKKDAENIKSLLDITNAIKSLQQMTVQEEAPKEAPSISINISAATEADVEDDINVP